jgi:dihydropteroate synthase
MLIDELRARVRLEYARECAVEPARECAGEPAVRTLIMGILNVTPDSFSDGGRYAEPGPAVDRAQSMIEDGADILDVGGESSRPGAEPLSPEAEWARVGAVLTTLAATGACISIDTYHAETARRAVELGARIVNDITALRGDPRMAEVVASAGCGCVLMHMRGTPQTMQQSPRYEDIIDDIGAFFEERLSFAVRAGIAEESLWLDPGFGFGKTPRHNLEILRRLSEFKKFGRPLMVGTSNKATIGAVLATPVHDRLEGTAATVALAIANGADCVRVHDVRAMTRVARMADAIVHR